LVKLNSKSKNKESGGIIMDFAKKYAKFLDMQQRRFPEWKVQDHGAGGHVEMMKDVVAKDGSKIMVFYWNDEGATIYRHPHHLLEKNRYVSMEEYDDPNINEKLWDDPYRKYPISIMYLGGSEVSIYDECREVFDDETVRLLANILLELKEVHSKWDQFDESYNKEGVTVKGRIGSGINYTIKGPSEIPFWNHDLKMELILGLLKTIETKDFEDKEKFQDKLKEIQEVIDELNQ
jgi:hypothetical protein